jgi:hypothetical protein
VLDGIGSNIPAREHQHELLGALISRDETELPLRYPECALEIRETQLGHDQSDTIALFLRVFSESGGAELTEV